MKVALLLALSLAFAAGGRAAGEPVQPAPFSHAMPGGALPPQWTPTRLPKVPRATEFSLVEDDGATVVRAQALASAATLAHALRVDPGRTPLLAWRWKITRVVGKADLYSKAGDDYAARLYVFFDYDPARLPFAERMKVHAARLLYGENLPAAVLCYVWDNRHPVGTRAWSSYTDRVRMIVVRSGNDDAGHWMRETRDVAADFREAFGEDPPPVSGVALGADTDNTGESLTSYFGDVEFLAPGGRR